MWSLQTYLKEKELTGFQTGETYEPTYPRSSSKLRHREQEREHSTHYMKLLQTSDADTLTARKESCVPYRGTSIMVGAHYSLQAV